MIGLKIAVGLPAYNEEKNIASIITKLASVSDLVIVCDDGSSDLTGKIATKMGAMVITHDKNKGYGSAIRSLFLKSKDLVVNDYHFLKRIINIVNELETTINSSKKTKVRIHDVNYFWKKQVSYKAKVKHFLKRKLRINVNNY